MGRSQRIGHAAGWKPVGALSRRSRLWAIAFACAVCVAPASAQQPPPSASDVAAARELFREAAQLAQQGRWEEARSHYERSYALRPSALTRYSLGLAQRETGRLVDSVESFRAFLRDPSDDATERYRAPAEQAIRELEPRLASLIVRAPAAAARAVVTVDGNPLLPAAVGVRRPVDPGRHRVEAKADGFAEFKAEVELSEGGAGEVTIVLSPATAAAKAPGASVPAAAPKAQPAPRTAAWVLAISGGALLASGMTLGGVGIDKARDAETSDGGEASSARTFALVGDITAGVGLVTAAIGTWMLLTPASKEPAPSRTAVRPWTGPGSAGLSFSGRF